MITRNEAGSFDSVIHADMFDRLTGNLLATKVAKDFEQAINFAKQVIAGYIYKLILEKAEEERQAEHAKAKQAKKEQAKERQAKQQEYESFEEFIIGYQEYLRNNYPQTTTTITTVEPNTESASYANAFLEAKTVEELSKLDGY